MNLRSPAFAILFSVSLIAAAGNMALQKKQQGSQRALAERGVTQNDYARAVASLSAARAHYYECISAIWATLRLWAMS